jgi:hypothetical protein
MTDKTTTETLTAIVQAGIGGGCKPENIKNPYGEIRTFNKYMASTSEYIEIEELVYFSTLKIYQCQSNICTPRFILHETIPIKRFKHHGTQALLIAYDKGIDKAVVYWYYYTYSDGRSKTLSLPDLIASASFMKAVYGEELVCKKCGHEYLFENLPKGEKD